MSTKHDFHMATALREVLTMKCDPFVDRHMSIGINEIIEYLCTN